LQGAVDRPEDQNVHLVEAASTRLRVATPDERSVERHFPTSSVTGCTSRAPYVPICPVFATRRIADIEFVLSDCVRPPPLDSRSFPPMSTIAMFERRGPEPLENTEAFVVEYGHHGLSADVRS
jgi:hypothetical protein